MVVSYRGRAKRSVRTVFMTRQADSCSPARLLITACSVQMTYRYSCVYVAEECHRVANQTIL